MLFDAGDEELIHPIDALQGREIEGTLVILGGIMTSTALSLFVLPTPALRYGRFGEMKLDT